MTATPDTEAAQAVSALSLDELRQFTGSERWYQHPLVKGVLYTDGARHVAQRAEAYWLLDEIALAQRLPLVAAAEFQCWRLTVADDRSAVLACEDGNGLAVWRKAIPWTDFPLPEIVLWLENGTLYLPSEH